MTRGICSQTVLDDALSGLPAFDEPPLRPIEVHRRVNLWAPTTFKHALRQLVEAGKAVRITDANGVHRYTKVRP